VQWYSTMLIPKKISNIFVYHVVVFMSLAAMVDAAEPLTSSYEKLREIAPVVINLVGKETAVQIQTTLLAHVMVVHDNRRSGELFPEDWLLLKVNGKNGSLVAEKSFYSSYGVFSIHIVDLDGDGKKEFIFMIGDGRGTSARKEMLVVERLVGNQFQGVLTTPLSDFYDSGKQWKYSVKYQSYGVGLSTLLVMTLKADEDFEKLRMNTLVPIDSIKTIKLLQPESAIRTLKMKVPPQSPPVVKRSTMVFE
jgi:hypothetical protein